jgi:hypothetical protein
MLPAHPEAQAYRELGIRTSSATLGVKKAGKEVFLLAADYHRTRRYTVEFILSGALP